MPDLRSAPRLLQLSIVVLLSIAWPTVVQAEVAQPIISAEHQVAAEALATLIVQPEGMGARVDLLASAIFAEFGTQDDALVQLEKAYPGTLLAVKTAMRPLLSRELERNTPRYIADLAGLYAANLSVEEIGEAVSFWRGPAGTNLRTTLAQNMRFNSQAHELVKADSVSSNSLTDDMRRAARGTFQNLTQQDRDAAEAFFASTLGRKFDSLNDKKLEIDAKWANYVSPAADAEMEKVVLNAMADHIGKSDPTVARAIRDEIGSGKR